MVLHDSKDQFYVELNRKIENMQITSQEFVDFINSIPDQKTSGFYELCSKFTDVSLNVPKKVNPKTCNVQACFQFSDINTAKSAFKTFVRDNDLIDIEGLLEAIHLMHPFSVAWDDPRSKGGIVRPENYNRKPGYAGKYYNFCGLPDENWNQIKDEIMRLCSE